MADADGVAKYVSIPCVVTIIVIIIMMIIIKYY